MQTCVAGYSPTEFQRSAFPPEYQPKLQTIFDGVDTNLWRKRSAEEIGPRTVAGREIPPDVHIVTYVSRGFESTRGFDIFMRVAKRICDATVVVCTDGVNHLLDEIRLPSGYFFHAPRSSKPRFLGFECHSILRDSLGKFDYYCYLEDDLVLHDAWLFRKLGAFAERVGVECLLQPNRYEGAHSDMPRKAYIDGELPHHATARFQNPSVAPEVTLDFMGTAIRCVRSSNPHAGCFFLNAEQMER